MNTVAASLRYPLSIGFGSVLVGTLFWALWALTSKSFQYEVMPAVDIDFTRIEREEVINTRDRAPRPERPVDLPDFERPPIGTGGGTEIVPILPRGEVNIPQLGNEGIQMGRDGDVAPLVGVQPTYPPREAQRGIEGWVTVQFDISTTGAVSNVVVVESEPGTAFDKAAVDAVARWRYNPRVENGQATERVGMRTRVSFDLEDE